MNIAEFNNLFPEEYREVIFGAENKLEEKKFTQNLYAALKNGKIATLIGQEKYKAKYASCDEFIIGFFKVLEGNIAKGEKDKAFKTSAHVLYKARKIDLPLEGLLPATIAKIRAAIEGGCKVEEQQKAAKELLQKHEFDKLSLEPSKAARFGSYPLEKHFLKDLRKRANELRADDFKKAKELQKIVDGQSELMKPKRKAAKEKTRVFPVKDFDGTWITGTQKFIYTGCPSSPAHAAALFDAMIANNGNLFVTTLELDEAPKRFNRFWQPENLAKMQLASGWKLEHAGAKIIARGTNPGKREPQIIETTLRATNGTTARTLTHFHYDGWIDREAAPDEEIFMTLLHRMHLLSAGLDNPILIHCHGGVGRTGTTGMCYEIFRRIDAQVAAGNTLDEISVNIYEDIYATRMQGRDVMGQETVHTQVHSMVAAYYEHLTRHEMLPILTGLPQGPVVKLISDYAL